MDVMDVTAMAMPVYAANTSPHGRIALGTHFLVCELIRSTMEPGFLRPVIAFMTIPPFPARGATPTSDRPCSAHYRAL